MMTDGGDRGDLSSDGLDQIQLLKTLVAIKEGDFSARMPVEWTGVAGKIADTLNDVIDLNARLAEELQRVSQVVGKEGETSARFSLGEVKGAWKGCSDSLNSLIEDLVRPTDELTRLITGVAQGDLSQRMALEQDGRELRGGFLQTAKMANTMVERLNSFASEVTRVTAEVGTEGKLGGQAKVEGVSGTWRDLTDSVNLMAGSLAAQVRNIAEVSTAVANGDLSKKITVDVKGEVLELKNTINTMVDQLNSFASEVTRVASEVGTEGRLGGQAYVSGVAGTWKGLTDSVNLMASNLTDQVRNIAQVTTAVANGDLTKKITVEAKGEILELKNTINTMVDQLNSFASEVSRVAREVGTEGKLGGQAQVRGISGTWKDLTDNVNSMAANLTDQVRGIAKVVTAVANGNLKQKLSVQAKGEIASLADTINGMIDTLATFADQVTTVAREVGVEGRLGGQANVPGAAGTWRDLTDNVNRLAANLTTQVRAIAEVATAVTEGDLTRSIQVEASGEVAVLKDNVNQMIANLRETTRVNAEQDWLKTNLAKFTRMLQGERDLLTVGKRVLSELAPVVSAQHGVFYLRDSQQAREPELRMIASYAYKERKNLATRFKFGEGLVGQAALEKERILLTNVPDDYIQISSGLGQGTPLNIIVVPVLFESEVKAVVELASFERFSPVHQAFLEQFSESLGIVLNTIEATMRTEELLKQSQAMAEELRSRQEALQKANEDLEEKAQQLAGQNAEVQRKNAEVERARQELEEKAEQLAVTSKYKSEFLSNMSHELRTPLNSLLLLSEQLAQNPDGNLTPKQVEFARIIHSSGSDLLALINDVLDLSKVESGKVRLDLAEVSFTEVRDYVERAFRPVAEDKKLGFAVELASDLPAHMYTDAQRLEQVLKNLLSNAFKFTEKGGVTLRIFPARGGWSPNHDILSRAGSVIAFSVADTGVGIPPEKQQLVFEAFQQGDGTTSRKYGGTGLGLSISREITKLLGGEIRLESQPGVGSTFTLYLPQTYVAPTTGSAVAVGAPGAPSAPPRPPEPEAAPPVQSSPPTGASTPAAPQQAVEVSPVAPLPEPVADDRDQIRPGDRTVLIVENDPVFATGLAEAAHRQGFKVLVTSRGERALSLASSFKPSAVSLDIYLPELDGWKVLTRLKEDASTRHIPVTIVTVETQEEQRRRGLSMGAIAYITKPTSEEALNGVFAEVRRFLERPVKRLLLVEKDEDRRTTVAELVGNGDVLATAVDTGAGALQALRAEPFDCVVLDPDLPDMDGFQLLEAMRGEARLRPIPVVLYPERDLAAEETGRLEKLADGLVVKVARSPERLLDETVLFLHRQVEKLPEEKRRMLEPLYRTESVLAGKKILIVDDDIRNVFALTAVLERLGVSVVSTDNGREAIEILESTPDIDLVLMDIMMPDMDGYETIRAIRSNRRLKSLPIVALTAKAMKGDREKSIEAGASDYIAKPVDIEGLLSMLKIWLRK